MHQGFWGTALIIEPEIERVSVIALGQSNASTWQFWRQVRDLIPVRISREEEQPGDP
jgi:hypothetical protein